MMMSKKLTLVLVCLCLVKLVYAQSSAPNIIVILADDLGYADVGFTGCKDIPTPNIDKIAKSGVVFTKAYVSYAVCGPSRAGLITGRYQDKFGFSDNPLMAPNDPTMGLPLTEQTLGDLVKQKQYSTVAIGKWHLGAHQTLRPNKRGFDEFYGFLSGGHDYLPENFIFNDLSEVKSQFDAYKANLLRNNQRVKETAYLTDALSREAVDFVARNNNKPFLLYLAYNAPHAPLQATKKYLDRFENIRDVKRKTYAAMVSAMDDGIGSLLTKLDELKLSENTIIFFLSDNGGPSHVNASSNLPFRGEKGSFFEGGVHVPFAMQWKGHITAGRTYNNPVSSLDIFATVAAVADAKPKNNLDGVNLIPFITQHNKGVPHTQLYWRNHKTNRLAVVTAETKLITEKDKKPMLFNLKNDISETNNIAELSANQNLLKDLDLKIIQWQNLLLEPKFEGLLDDKKYTSEHPERWIIKDNK
ncbi:sulfatase-like hydrolase/transferase [Pedobacter arcticus]|uniref:sulfatase-like hydrolase/transferase n=1 Tax=Pedobacter arcticus TaxID=752140 RepID=UPI00030A8749|nr:sulfatase-like hydrolase/transferase [Pedobacter arcticus]